MNYFRKRRAAFGYAFKGISNLITNEAHAIIHLLATLLVIAAGVFFEISLIEWGLVFICIGGVFGAECFNTAIERLADRITTEQDPYIGSAKDLGAAGVLFMAIASIAVAAIIFLPKILLWIK